MSRPVSHVPHPGAGQNVLAVLVGSALALAEVAALLVVCTVLVILCLAPVLVAEDQIDLGFALIDTRSEAWLVAAPSLALVLLIGFGSVRLGRRQAHWLRDRLNPPMAVAAAPNNETTELDGLTEREAQVLGLMSQGLTNGAIAQELFISEATVRKHVGRIFAKLDVDAVGNDRRVSAVLIYRQDTERRRSEHQRVADRA